MRKTLEIDLDEKSHFNKKWMRVHADTEYTLRVAFSRRQISNKVSLASKIKYKSIENNSHNISHLLY